MKKVIILTVLMIIILTAIFSNISNAIQMSSAEVYISGRSPVLLKYGNMNVATTIVVYQKDGIEYPAYCLQRDLDGVGEEPSYTVDTNTLLSNVMVWRAIINGYPYKTIEQLGCQTREEAFLATKQAVYCMLYNRSANEYSGIGEAGQRTWNALNQIVTNARNSGASKISSEIFITEENSIWKLDNINQKYISKTFIVTSNAGMNEYTVGLEGETPEGVILADKSNNEKHTFNYGEKFKILIPIQSNIKDGNFHIKVEGNVKTKPIIYGKAPNSNLQDYALTGSIYEDGKGIRKVNYAKNETKIIILKQEKDTKKPLQGVQFELLDENQNVIHTSLLTGENGKIVIKNLLPGTYYIKEISTLEGYTLYDKLMKLEVELNEESTLIVNNSQEEPIIEVEFKETTTEVEMEEEKTEVSLNKSNKKVKLPKTGM